jgi:hypothetical protein
MACMPHPSPRPERRRRRHRRHHRERKERVLHTRISEPLAEEIRRMADDLRVPVSNLVRNVLEEAFSVVEAVTDNVGDWIEEVVEEAERAHERLRGRRAEGAWSADSPPEPGPDARPPREFPDVIGWQPWVLERERTCSDCGEAVPRGARAFVGATPSGPADALLCRRCLDARH